LSNHLLNTLAQPVDRLRLQLDEFLPVLMGEDDGDDVLTISVHGNLSFLAGRTAQGKVILLMCGSIEK
jgi:hypothetical protein